MDSGLRACDHPGPDTHTAHLAVLALAAQPAQGTPLLLLIDLVLRDFFAVQPFGHAHLKALFPLLEAGFGLGVGQRINSLNFTTIDILLLGCCTRFSCTLIK